jgi:hypothetical protein
MAADDDKGNKPVQPAPGESRKLGRRDVLKGLSTVPALGLFGYAWKKQSDYQQASREVAAPHRRRQGSR